MIQVFVDTSYKTLTVAALVDGQVQAFYHAVAFKSQSELVMKQLDEVMQEANLRPTDIDELIVTVGPGSYTGVRIALTLAKVLASISTIRIKTITSLEMFVKTNTACMVVFDARSERLYAGVFKDGQYTLGPHVRSGSDAHTLLKTNPMPVYGDGHLLDQVEDFDLEPRHVETLVKKAELVEDVDQLKPLYLKEMSAY